VNAAGGDHDIREPDRCSASLQVRVDPPGEHRDGSSKGSTS
jgi:hypothetical protein